MYPNPKSTTTTINKTIKKAMSLDILNLSNQNSAGELTVAIKTESKNNTTMEAAAFIPAMMIINAAKLIQIL